MNTTRIRASIGRRATPVLIATVAVVGGTAIVGSNVHAQTDDIELEGVTDDVMLEGTDDDVMLEGTDDGVVVEGFIDDQSLAASSSNNPVVLESDTTATLRVDITNADDQRVEVSRVRLEGRALGVVFVAYDASVQATTPAGGSTDLDIPLTFYDLGDQATGLLPATLIAFDQDGNEIATQQFTLDVRGELTSIIGLFALTIIGLTVLGALLLTRQIAGRRLPANRWQRALQFAPIGLGVGLIATIALAVLRIAAPYGMVWFPLLVVPMGIAFVLGYFAPGPLDDEDAQDEFDGQFQPAGGQITSIEQPENVAVDVESPAAPDDPFATRPASAPTPVAGTRS